MNTLAAYFQQLTHAEFELAREYRSVAQRQSSEHDVAAMCETLAKQCEARVVWLTQFADELHVDVASGASSFDGATWPQWPESDPPDEIFGPGWSLLADLRSLFVRSDAVALDWELLLQILAALPATDLKEKATPLHEEVLVQSKWAKTRLKVSTPQIVLVPVGVSETP